MNTNKAVNAIILAGGRNSRMGGEDKAFLEIGGRPIIAILIEKLKPLVNQIIVVTNSPEKYNNYKVTLVADEAFGKGPLMGVYSGLKASSAKYNFVVACDMPFIKKSLIKFMLDSIGNYIWRPKSDPSALRASGSRKICPSGRGLRQIFLDKKNDYDILLFKDSEKFHTLFGVYSKACIPVMEEMLQQNSLRISDIFHKLNTHFLSKQEMERFDPNLLSLANINTPQELEKIRQSGR